MEYLSTLKFDNFNEKKNFFAKNTFGSIKMVHVQSGESTNGYASRLYFSVAHEKNRCSLHPAPHREQEAKQLLQKKKSE